MRLSLLSLLAAAGIAQAAEETAAFTDPATGINFQTYSHSSGFKFGVALPATPSDDFIGYLVSNSWYGRSI
jgi:cellobiose dehydrogenase (acceptor)